VEAVFAAQEGTAFVTGDGSNKPKGFLAYDTVANASWSWGNLGTIASGAAGAFTASHPSDALVDLIYALKAGYRQNANFVMNRKVLGLGVTDPLKGDVADWAMIVLTAYFGGRSLEKVARILARR